MKSKEAVVKRINELCAVNDIALNELANRSGITPSTVYSIMLPQRIFSIPIVLTILSRKYIS